MQKSNLTWKFKEYQAIMDHSKDGVVLIAFGLMTPSSAMPSDAKQSFLNMFKAFPQVFYYMALCEIDVF